MKILITADDHTDDGSVEFIFRIPSEGKATLTVRGRNGTEENALIPCALVFAHVLRLAFELNIEQMKFLRQLADSAFDRPGTAPDPTEPDLGDLPNLDDLPDLGDLPEPQAEEGGAK